MIVQGIWLLMQPTIGAIVNDIKSFAIKLQITSCEDIVGKQLRRNCL